MVEFGLVVGVERDWIGRGFLVGFCGVENFRKQCIGESALGFLKK